MIVDDGSTDRTAEVARQAIAGDSGGIARPAPRGRPVDFVSKVRAFNAGVEALGETPYDFIGNLDADITLPRNYYERCWTGSSSDHGSGWLAVPSPWRSTVVCATPNEWDECAPAPCSSSGGSASTTSAV